jgi:hypothetical protein
VPLREMALYGRGRDDRIGLFIFRSAQPKYSGREVECATWMWRAVPHLGNGSDRLITICFLSQ